MYRHRIPKPRVGNAVRHRQLDVVRDLVFASPSVVRPYKHVGGPWVVTAQSPGRANHERVVPQGYRTPEAAAGRPVGRIQNAGIVPIASPLDKHVGPSTLGVVISGHTDNQHLTLHGDRVSEAVPGGAIKRPKGGRIRERGIRIPAVRRLCE